MWITLSKTVGRLLDPIGFIWLILVLGLLHAIFKKQTINIIFCGGLALLLTIIGGTKLPAWLLSQLEKQYAIENLESLPDCDAVVVLGGIHSFDTKGAHDIEFNFAADRIVMAAELVRLNKSEALVIGGGYATKNELLPAGTLLKKWL